MLNLNVTPGRTQHFHITKLGQSTTSVTMTADGQFDEPGTAGALDGCDQAIRGIDDVRFSQALKTGGKSEFAGGLGDGWTQEYGDEATYGGDLYDRPRQQLAIQGSSFFLTTNTPDGDYTGHRITGQFDPATGAVDRSTVQEWLLVGAHGGGVVQTEGRNYRI